MLFAVSTSSQSQLVVLCIFLFFLFRRPKLVVLALFVGLISFSLIAPIFPTYLHGIDPNTGIRAMFWHDTWIVIRDTSGLGVGYGTEYIQNNFVNLKHSDWTIVSEYSKDRLLIGTHSAVYDVLLRNGVVGTVLFLFWYIPVIFGRGKLNSKDSGLFWAVSAMLLINNFVNMGFTAINFLFGSTMCLGLLCALKLMSKSNYSDNVEK